MMTEGNRGAGRALPGRLIGACGLPLAAALVLAGQCLLSTKGLPAARTILPGAGLYLLAGAIAGLTLWRRRDEPLIDQPGRIAETAETGTAWLRRALPPGVEPILVAAVLIGALWLRLNRIDILPRGLNNDEAINALEVHDIVPHPVRVDGVDRLVSRPFSTVTERGLNRETMFHYLAAMAMRKPGLVLNLLRAMPWVFGLQPRLVNDELMDLIFPLRSVAVAGGMLTLLALYLFARDRFGWRVALLATVFLSVSPWHLLYSRVGFRVILAPIFALAAVGFFLRALESRRLRDHLLWGASIGLGLWTYTSFRIIPIALALFFLLRRFLDPGADRPLPRRPLLAGAGLAALGGLLVLGFSHMSPLAFLGRGGAELSGGSGVAASLARGILHGHLFHAITMMQYFPPAYAQIQDLQNGFISDGVSTVYGRAGLEPETSVVAALGALGVVYLIARARRRRDPASALILLCVASLLFSVGMFGPSLTRLLLNLPWFCLIAALLAWRVCDDLAALLRPLCGAALSLILAIVLGVAPLVVWAGAQGYRNLFLRAGVSEKAMEYFWPRQTIMGMFVRSIPPRTIVYVLHSYGRETLTYLIGDRPDVHLVTDPTTLDLTAIGRLPRSATFVVEYSEYSRPFAEALRYLIMRYPQGEMTQVADGRLDPDKIIFYTFNLYKGEDGQPIAAPPEAPAPGSAVPGGPVPPS